MIVGGFEHGVGLWFLFLVFIASCFSLHIDPAIDRRIIYNDFRSNPYLHFDAGLVPRALGVQLGEFYCLFIRLLFSLACFHCILCFVLVVDRLRIDIIVIDCDHSLGHRDYHLC